MAQWKKGQSGNPNGPTVHTPMQLVRSKMTMTHFRALLWEWGQLTDEEVRARAKNKMSQFDYMIVSIIGEARGGNITAWNSIMDRVYGKPKEQIEVSTVKPNTITRRNGDVIECGVIDVTEE